MKRSRMRRRDRATARRSSNSQARRSNAARRKARCRCLTRRFGRGRPHACCNGRHCSNARSTGTKTRCARLARPWRWRPPIRSSRAATRGRLSKPAFRPSDLYEQALRLAPHDGQVLAGLVAARFAAGNGEQAERELAAILARHPDWIDGHMQLAQLRSMIGKIASIAQSFESALAAAPRDERPVARVVRPAHQARGFPWPRHGDCPRRQARDRRATARPLCGGCRRRARPNRGGRPAVRPLDGRGRAHLAHPAPAAQRARARGASPDRTPSFRARVRTKPGPMRRLRGG